MRWSGPGASFPVTIIGRVPQTSFLRLDGSMHKPGSRKDADLLISHDITPRVRTGSVVDSSPSPFTFPSLIVNKADERQQRLVQAQEERTATRDLVSGHAAHVRDDPIEVSRLSRLCRAVSRNRLQLADTQVWLYCYLRPRVLPVLSSNGSMGFRNRLEKLYRSVNAPIHRRQGCPGQGPHMPRSTTAHSQQHWGCAFYADACRSNVMHEYRLHWRQDHVSGLHR